MPRELGGAFADAQHLRRLALRFGDVVEIKQLGNGTGAGA